jgi:uncharacterized protein (TIGR00661 family)
MRILYGVHGYGLGHATRASSVISRLSARHQILLLAGGDARAALEPVHPVYPIPSLGYVHRGAKVSPLETLARNAPGFLDALAGGPTRRLVEGLIGAFKPDLVISDAEIFTHRAAARLGVPRIGFDHFGVLAHASPPAPAGRAVHLAAAAAFYRLMMGQPDRAIVSSFYDAPARRPGVAFVPTLLRPEVLAATPARGDHLLVYLNRARHQLTARIERALQALDVPSRLYGAGREGAEGRITYRRVDPLRFVEDLASCRAIFSTAGNQLVGEAMHLGKALLVAPDDSTEQHVNADAVTRLGIGRQVSRDGVDEAALRSFLEQADTFAARARRLARDGTDAAVETIERFAAELCGVRASPSRRAA